MDNSVTTVRYNVSPAYTEQEGQMPYPESYESAKDILQTYVVPVIIITGLIGNTISFVVFLASPLKRISTSLYLAALAFSDSGFLVCLGIGWLESLDIRLFHKEGICQITVYASFVFSFTSIWFVNAFTLEMYIAVFHTRKSPKLCVPKTARKIVGVLTLIAAAIYIYSFWIAKLVETSRSSNKVCLIIPEDAKSAMIFSVFDTILTLVVPFTMIIIMMGRLLVHISRFYSTELESGPSSTVMETNGEESTAHPAVRQASEAHSKLTRMLVVTVVVFLVLNLPSHAIKVQFLIRSLLSPEVQFTETEGFMQVVFQILYYANFSVNFVLYSACGRSFRGAIIRMTINLRYGSCFERCSCRKLVQTITKTAKTTKETNDESRHVAGQQHSRLVDIHLDEIRFSQLPSIDSQFICQSPPCLLAFESEHLMEQQGFQ
ncbi:somatostatin receptor type 2-like [Mya arenaria]|uniref:somatostatin receptor type 2-like n=1 Tax=Mya arenaria TaxID=6604 RepID=UPI0022E117D9|nr:somatostatin receptor type 2-like [Mya arenaria]